MNNSISVLSKAAFLAAALLAPMAVTPVMLQAQDQRQEQRTNRTYHDAGHNDDHEWNKNENQAYRVWVKQNHRRNTDFSRLKENDQQSYWGWRHEHSDATLNINIR